LLPTNCCCRQLDTRRPVFRRAVHLPDRGLEACSLAVAPTSGCYPLRLPPPGCVFLALRASATPMEFLVPSTREHRVARLQAANPSRAVHRVSHPLDGFSSPARSALFHAVAPLGFALFRGFPPPSGLRALHPQVTLLALLPLPVYLGFCKSGLRGVPLASSHQRNPLHCRLQGVAPTMDPCSFRRGLDARTTDPLSSFSLSRGFSYACLATLESRIRFCAFSLVTPPAETVVLTRAAL
jgi:hypothetical protein